MMREIAEYTTFYPHRTVDKREKNILIIYGILVQSKKKIAHMYVNFIARKGVKQYV